MTTASAFGHRRAEILAAAVNGVLLAGTAVAVIVEACRRLLSPHEVAGGRMLIVASAGLVANSFVAAVSILTLRWMAADAITSILISILIFFGAWLSWGGDTGPHGGRAHWH